MAHSNRFHCSVKSLIDLESLENFFVNSPLNSLAQSFESILNPINFPENIWVDAIKSLPPLNNAVLNCQEFSGVKGDSAHPSDEFIIQLKKLMPWRKGPFNINGIAIDTEWHSDFKWQRLKNALNFDKKVILDVGCGNGYFGYQMMNKGAKSVIGIDPSLLFLCQFSVIKKYLPKLPIWQIPITLEALIEYYLMHQKSVELFDITLSMGVLYHRKSPLEHLTQLKSTLNPNGQLVLETIVIEGDENTCLIPKSRYAKMRNVWFLPSIAMLKIWLERIGFTQINIIDVSTTTTKEQRSTEWMTFQSLSDFLNPKDQTKTIEGYPAPKRVLLVAQ